MIADRSLAKTECLNLSERPASSSTRHSSIIGAATRANARESRALRTSAIQRSTTTPTQPIAIRMSAAAMSFEKSPIEAQMCARSKDIVCSLGSQVLIRNGKRKTRETATGCPSSIAGRKRQLFTAASTAA